MPSTARRTVADRQAGGRAARTEAPRSGHATLDLAPDRDPIALLDVQNASRVSELVPIRNGRMVASPLAFLRGAAVVMAHDLMDAPSSGLHVQLCGDAHLLNFGGFATPERSIVFDVNDFDETHPGPFEWDVKRLAVSLEVAGRARGFGNAEREAAVMSGVRSYREAMRSFARLGELDVWYARLDAQAVHDRLRAAHDQKMVKKLDRTIAKAQAKDGRATLATLTQDVEGERRFVSEPPLVVPLAELDDASVAEAAVRDGFRSYRRSLQPDRRVLVERFRLGDIARKVVGVGSVGTRCWVLLLFGRDDDDPLFLQMKEAHASVYGPSSYANEGERVVQGQRLMQAASDILLGWVRIQQEVDGQERDFYVRQLRDWKVSLELEAILPRGLGYYATACGWTLARAHARSGDRIAIAGYLGGSDTFDRSIAAFAAEYADLNENDHAALVRAVAERRVPALEDV